MREPRIVVASQPRYLPSAAYLHRLLLADVLVYLDTVQYTPRDWENRNRIKSPSGPLWLTVPVVHTTREQTIVETEIDPAQDWGHRHLRALELNYRRAPYFGEVFGLVESLFSRRWTMLWELNLAVTDALVGYLGRRAEWVRASTLGVEAVRGQELLVALCGKVQGELYLSGPLGRNYIEPGRFRESGLTLAFHDYVPAPYPQLHGEFLPSLSVIDLLFNCGRGSLAVIEAGHGGRAVLARADAGTAR
jgi:hypothetical protein